MRNNASAGTDTLVKEETWYKVGEKATFLIHTSFLTDVFLLFPPAIIAMASLREVFIVSDVSLTFKSTGSMKL